ncbi:MAG TPA: hypothetical protein VN950_03060 [Terriglobales bacterium]|nr:hypothetical protein [Terriglobales bacterium]
MPSRKQKWTLISGFLIVLFACGPFATAQVSVVDMVPASNSGETNRDSEPSLAVNPANPSVMAASAFTPDPGGTLTGVLYFSIDGGQTWQITPAFVPASVAPLNCITTYCDITLRYGGTSNQLYLSFLENDSLGNNDLQVGGVPDITVASPIFNSLETFDGSNGHYKDQPWVQAVTAGNDQAYVTNNNTTLSGDTASVDLSSNPVPPPPAGFNSDAVDRGTTCGQDGPSVRPAVSPTGTIYLAFYRWTGSCSTADIVVVRDDNWGQGATPFQALGANGTTVASGVPIFFDGLLGTQRTGSQMAIAVDPLDSGTVYVAWGDGSSGSAYTLHVRHSTNSGANWDTTDLQTIPTATNPGLAINSHSVVGFLYQQLGNPGAGNRWRTHLGTTNNTFSTVQDLILADVPDNEGTYGGANPIGDYDNVNAIGQDFYGVFSGFNHPDLANFPNGVSYLRYHNFTNATLYTNPALTTPVSSESIDPYFFHLVEVPPSQNFYVRDWTASPTSYDLGQEPSTNPVWWTESDVWNRLNNDPNGGGFNANNQPFEQVAQEASVGHNYAFARISREAAAVGAPDIQVTAQFLIADYGLGVPYTIIGSAAPVTFAATDTTPQVTAGLQWDIPAGHSNHVCLAVEISSPGDPFYPDLSGRDPGVSDPLIVWDNNKAQINMDFPPSAGGGSDTRFGIVHNGELYPRNIIVGLQADPEVLRQLGNAQVEVIGDRSQPFENGGTITLANMLPGENRWIGVTFTTPNGDGTKTLPITFTELAGNKPVNGFTIAAVPSPLSDVIRDNLKSHAAVYTRLNSTFDIDVAKDEGEDARHLFREGHVSDLRYLEFLQSHQKRIDESVSKLLAKEKGQDLFGVQQALQNLKQVIASNSASAAAMADATLLNKLDAFQTMLQKAEGDAADILQMVRWQKQLYMNKPQLQNLPGAHRIVEESGKFISEYGKRKMEDAAYRELILSLVRSFHETAESLEKINVKIEPELHRLEEHLVLSVAGLEKAHHEYLVRLQGL